MLISYLDAGNLKIAGQSKAIHADKANRGVGKEVNFEKTATTQEPSGKAAIKKPTANVDTQKENIAL